MFALTYMKHILMLAVAIFLIGCTEAPKHTLFPTERMLTSLPVPVDTVLLRFPYRIAVEEDIMLVMDLHPERDYLHAFSLPEGKHIKSFGRRGQAGDEMLSAENFRFCSFDSIWILDANRMNIVRWSLAVTSANAVREEAINLDKSLVRTLDFCLTDSGFIIPDYLGDSRYNFVGWNGIPSASAGIIPVKKNKRANSVALAQGWRSFFALNPDKNVLATATQLGEVIEIYRLDSISHTVVYGSMGEPQFQVVHGEALPVGIMGYFDIQATDNYIYALFSGKTFKEIQKNAMTGTINERGGRFIHVYDFQGNPVCIYLLDRAVCGIDVHENEGLIYAVDANGDDPVVVFRIDGHIPR